MRVTEGIKIKNLEYFLFMLCKYEHIYAIVFALLTVPMSLDWDDLGIFIWKGMLKRC